MNERMKVLEMLEQGKLKADEAVRLLEVLDSPPCTPASYPHPPQSPPPSPSSSPQPDPGSREEKEIYKQKKRKGE